MSKRKLPTLKQTAGERPRCQYCGKELKPVTETVEVTGQIAALPLVDELLQMPQFSHAYPSTADAIKRGYQPERVFRLSHKATFKHEPYMLLRFWTGGFCGRGVLNGVPSFCKAECGVAFGTAAWRAGYRIKPK